MATTTRADLLTALLLTICSAGAGIAPTSAADACGFLAGLLDVAPPAAEIVPGD